MVILNNRSISGESFFEDIPKRFYVLEPKFVQLGRSIIWHFNYLFWKHLSLWEKTYGEHYESSLPSGISESHREEFILKSTKKFISLLMLLEKENSLPKEIVVLEQGPGTGQYAKKFLDYLKIWSNKNKKVFYQRLIYVLQDISWDILHTTSSTLNKHANHILVCKNIPSKLKNKILFARHSNLWDQLPCRILTFHDNTTSELLVQAILNADLEKDLSLLGKSLATKSLLPHIQKKHIREIITTYPELWKPLVRNIKLKTKLKPFTVSQLNQAPYLKGLKELVQESNGVQEITFSKGILDNIKALIDLIDWKRYGYIEIVDIVVPDITGFRKDRRPKKFDGSIATAVNGPLVKLFLQGKGKHVIFEKIRGINHTVTIGNNSLKRMLQRGNFLKIAEIAVRRDRPLNSILDQAKHFYTKGVDVIAFSDQALANIQYLTLPEVVASEVFEKLPGDAILPILKVRNKTLKEIDTLTNQLKKQKVSDIFLVTGDPDNESQKVLNTAISVLPKLSKRFFVGMVTHPRKEDIPKMLDKINKGAKFFIMQATYNQDILNGWLKEVKKKEIHKSVPIIAAIIPIVSMRTLSAIRGIGDIAISSAIIKKFEDLSEDAMRKEGVALAKDLLKMYKEAGVFSGVYIYSKSQEVILDVLGL